MKKISLIITILLSVILNVQLKAQDDDPNEGWYVDGYKSASISCYNFSNLQLVVPYNSTWAGYDMVSIKFWKGDAENDYCSIKMFSKAAVQGIKKGNYLVFSVITPDQTMETQYSYRDGTPQDDNTSYGPSINKWSMAYQIEDIGDRKKRDTQAEDVRWNAKIYGLSQSEVIEKYEEGCQCVRKITHYTSEILSKPYSFTATGRIWKKYNTPLSTDPCTYSGTKVDVNKLGSSSASQSSAGNTSVKTTTNTNAQAPASATTPYTEKHENGKISVQGQKNKDDAQEGTWKYFDENGKLERIENYKNGIADGEWKYYEEGKLTKTEVYKEGEMISSKETE